MFDLPDASDLIARALAEDLGVPVAALTGEVRRDDLLAHDLTSEAVLPQDAWFGGVVVSRSYGVACGLPLLERVFETLAEAADPSGEVDVFPLVAEGAFVEPGDEVAEVSGPARVVLAAERTALDFLMVLSGIASAAARWQDEAGDSLRVVDTRKTIPGLRALSKYAVRVGGAQNHREGLFDMVLIKDNHLRWGGGIETAVEAARKADPGVLVQVEADTVEQAREAAEAGADMVLLDNMDDVTLAEAVRAVRETAEACGSECLTEASGGISIERVGALRATLVDRVSTSAITMAPPLDFGLDEKAG